ncbi:MAG: leucine-rich repeat protein [Ruminococcus sp.]|nr:leucine-rich repeat protein [Ruminococcus sp.]
MKRIVSVLLCVVIVLTMLSSVTFATFADVADESLFTFYHDGNGYVVLDYLGNDAQVKIPDTYCEYPIVGISEYAFSDCTFIESVELPDSITFIGLRAFQGCTGLKSVKWSDGLNSIGQGAFSGCSSLETAILPDSVSEIQNNAFEYCRALTEITIPETVPELYRDVLIGCDNLSSITIYNRDIKMPSHNPIYVFPEGVTIYGYAYSTAYNYAELWGVKFCVLDTKTEGDFTYVVHNDETTIVKYIGEEQEVVVPSEIEGKAVTVIFNDAFLNCESIESISLPDSVTTIKKDAFCGCSELKSVEWSDNITSIDWGIFRNCISLQSITIPKGITVVSKGMFEGCTNLKNVVISDSVTEISYDAFVGCSSLTDITLPPSVESIQPTAFEDCVALKTITIYNPNCIMFGNLFPQSTIIYGYDGSRAETYSIEHGYKFRIIGTKEIDGLEYYENDNNEIVIINYCGDNTQVVIPSQIDDVTVTTIKEKAFLDSENIESVEIPGSVKAIKERAFMGCRNLKQVIINDGVETIGQNAFNGCYSLVSVIIPESVVSVGENAFWNCRDLEIITFLGKDCDIFDDYKTISGAVRIYAHKNSSAHLYARNYNRGLMYLADETVPVGDTNGDGVVSIMDATETQKQLAGLGTASGTSLTPQGVRVSIDADNDGVISVLDATKTQLFLAEIITQL